MRHNHPSIASVAPREMREREPLPRRLCRTAPGPRCCRGARAHLIGKNACAPLTGNVCEARCGSFYGVANGWIWRRLAENVPLPAKTTWSMSNRTRSPSASREALKGAISSGLFYARVSFWRRRRGRRHGWRVYRFSSHDRLALRCFALRPLHFRRRNRRAHRRCHCRQLRPCAARHAPRSDHYTPLRMTY
jgi:hypothetical protein